MSYFDIAIMLDDPELQRLVATWGRLNKQQRTDVSVIADAANIPRSRINIVLDRAKLHGLINDDGSIHANAHEFLNALVGERIVEMHAKIKKHMRGKDDKKDSDKE